MLIGLDKYRSMLISKIPEINSSIILSGHKSIGKFSLISEVLSELVNNDINIHVIKSPEGKSNIGVEQIREVFELINIVPYGDPRHYIIIDDADEMTEVAFNLLLKRLEEPKKSELFILITSDLYSISDTIKSRCLNINIELDYNEIQSYINKIDDTDIQMVLNKLGFAYVILYINSDTIKSRCSDSKQLALDVINLNSKKSIANYTSKILKNVDLNMEFLNILYPDNECVRNAYNMIKSDFVVNKQIIIDIMLYEIIKQNTE